MFDKLREIETRFEIIGDDINKPEVIADQARWRGLMKEHATIGPIVEKYREFKRAEEALRESREMLNESLDDEMRALVREEVKDSAEKMEIFGEELKILLLPKDPNDEKNVIVEIRGGAGGDEAALFASDLHRMYSRYAERNRWKVETLSANENDLGGIKEIAFMIAGKGAYSRLKYESGVHRVQRVPTTESQGRIHTSTVTVAVLPEAEEVDVALNMNEIRVDVFRSSGCGGQSVNTTDSAVRVTHNPTGIVVSCQDEKSQHKNKDKALRILRARLYDLELEKQAREQRDARRSQVGTGDRSEKIRTYNFPQSRVTDHRVNKTIHRLEAFLDGDLEEMTEVLITTDQAEKLKMES
ncbi:MAG: peptide chain release factor 1 [Clostridiales bacterium]|jgi:peptide chain release factor 1|nr:peptide chain release factor 1 [Clostridiales bacterium]